MPDSCQREVRLVFPAIARTAFRLLGFSNLQLQFYSEVPQLSLHVCLCGFAQGQDKAEEANIRQCGGQRLFYTRTFLHFGRNPYSFFSRLPVSFLPLSFFVIFLNLLLNIHLFLILSIPIIGRAGFLLLIYLLFFTHAHILSLNLLPQKHKDTSKRVCMCVYNICAHVVDYLHQPLNVHRRWPSLLRPENR